MKKYLLFLFLFYSAIANAQTILKGKVIDEKTKEELSGISIYINSTTIGTITDNEGEFTLTIPFNGKVELVVSHLIYQKKMILIDANSKETLLIALKPQNNTLNEVVIKSSRNKDDNYNKWGYLFTKILMGTDSHFAHSCKIKNPETLVFYFDKETNELSVFAKEPLVIENSVMAYKVKLDMENFKYAFNTDVLQVNYSTFFEELPIAKGKERNVKAWRYSAYYGSQMHFMRSVYQNNLTREGFTLYAYRTIKNKEKERVSKIIQLKIGQTFAANNNPNYELKTLFKDRDTAGYYQLIMKQNDIVALDTTKVSLRKLAVLDREMSTVKFNFKDTLMINYKPNSQSKQNITGKEVVEVKNSHGTKKNDGLNTYMYFIEDGGINIQNNGYYSELRLFIYGNMSERRISQLLPWDYEPDKPNL
ncbi:carboxypeptidase-like regulatory domain-containing protein [Pedobacter polaris]|uniref:Carboxypeptidase-like regulatory domain-containing protein n=1 Tax=Pedobacter polaris TaxID=2571273 RepID=A0A4U1CRH8_9SPHI|nr:carboxypeptidase-like regulatory domain-containing protein [Pedobacter polaris]TKC10671.1 carboxypeptidase-like regulatory domain-containing protein [Pedobacter polaris]